MTSTHDSSFFPLCTFNHYNLTNVLTTLYLGQMKWIPGPQYFLCVFTNLTLREFPLTALSLCECKLVFCSVLWRVYVRRIYGSITRSFKFDCSIQVTQNWRTTVNQIDLSKHKYLLLQNTRGNKFSSCYLFLSLSEQVVYFHETDIITLFWVIIYRFLQKFFKISVFKIFAKFTGNRSLLLISLEPTTFLTRDSDTGAFFGILQNCQEHNFYRTPLDYWFCICLWYHKT